MKKITPWHYWASLLLISCTQLHAAIFTVTRTNISGPGSFPVVLNQANATPGDHVIEFAIPGTILLTTSLPPITNNITINGRGTNETIISGGDSVSLLAFASSTTCFVSRVTLTRAFRSGDGGAIWNDGYLFLSDCSVLAN